MRLPVCATTAPKHHGPHNPGYPRNPSISGRSIRPNAWRRLNSTALGVWGDMLRLLRRLKGVELKIVFLDSTVVRAHQHAAGAAKKKAIRPSVAPVAD